MANAFDNMAGRMDELTAKRLGRTVTINGDEHIAVESHLLPELGPVAGDGINLVIFSAGYQPARGDEVIYKSQVYTVKGIHFRSLTDSIDTSTPAGRFFFHVMSALAEMERELIVERTRAGLAAAREQGRVGGRRRVMTTEVVERCRRMLENGATRQQVADVTGVGVKTIYKYFPVQYGDKKSP